MLHGQVVSGLELPAGLLRLYGQAGRFWASGSRLETAWCAPEGYSRPVANPASRAQHYRPIPLEAGGVCG